MFFRPSSDNEFKAVLADVLEASKSKNTIDKYKRAFEGWRFWCLTNKVTPFAANAEDVSRYLIHLHQIDAPYSRMEAAFYGIKWHYDCVPRSSNPCDCKFLHNVLLGLKRIHAKPIVKKDPITPDIIKALVSKFGHSNSLIDLRLCTMTLLAYAGFLRHNELINIRRCDLEIYSSHVSIFIIKSKTDIFRQGAWVLIGATHSMTCPVGMLRRYLAEADLHNDADEDFLFRPVNFCKSLNTYKLRSGQLSYTRCLELLKQALFSVGLDPKKFGMHSLRSGGASAAANIGVPDRLFKKHGRWRSETAKDGYIQDSMKDRLSVSLNLGL